MTAGRVASLHRWPVKSLAGEAVDAATLDRRGVAGDRAHALFDEHKGAPRRLTVRQAPAMLHWSARYEEPVALDEIPLPRLTAPDGHTYGWDQPELAKALSEDLGRDVELRRDVELMPDLQDSVLVTTQGPWRRSAGTRPAARTAPLPHQPLPRARCPSPCGGGLGGPPPAGGRDRAGAAAPRARCVIPSAIPTRPGRTPICCAGSPGSGPACSASTRARPGRAVRRPGDEVELA